jgi:predicted kinase
VSTDRIRQQFYGNEAIQGAWPQVERRVLHQIRKALGAGQSVIYDATNVRRSWRVDLLQKLQDSQTPWIGWHFQVALADCLTQNQRRIRQVPKGVIEEAFDQLHHYPPEPREGFTAVYPVPMVAGQPDLQQMQRLYRSIRNEDSRG